LPTALYPYSALLIDQIVVAVVGVGFDLTQGIGGAEQSVPAVVGKGGDLVTNINI